MEIFMFNVLVSSLAAALVLYTANVVWNHCYPPPSNWIEVDGWEGRKTYLEHILDCGLIYPCLYIYAWVAIHELLKASGF